MKEQQIIKSAKFISESTNWEGKWMRIKSKNFSVMFKDEESNKVEEKQISWETVDNSKSQIPVDSVEIIPIVRRKDKEMAFLLEEIYRFPVQKNIIEFPAGGIDGYKFPKLVALSNENIEDKESSSYKEFLEEIEKAIQATAISEMKEETGYKVKFLKILNCINNSVGKFDSLSGIVEAPWIMNTKVALCLVEIEDFENQVVKQELETEEIIKTHLVPKSELMSFISKKLIEGCCCDKSVYYFATFMNFANIFL